MGILSSILYSFSFSTSAVKHLSKERFKMAKSELSSRKYNVQPPPPAPRTAQDLQLLKYSPFSPARLSPPPPLSRHVEVAPQIFFCQKKFQASAFCRTRTARCAENVGTLVDLRSKTLWFSVKQNPPTLTELPAFDRLAFVPEMSAVMWL